MSGRLVLHVGAMKSGTSYLQSRLFANKRLLAERGILVPGSKWVSQVMAARDLIGPRAKQWPKMSGKVLAHPGTSVISMEYLGPVRPGVARRVRETFEGSTGVTVLITARDLNRSIAAMWQETVQNGRSWTFAEYLEGIERWRPGVRDDNVERPETGRTFWRQQNIVRLVRTWSDVFGIDDVVLLTVPPPGAPRELLWDRFCQVLGTEPDGLAEAPKQNESIGVASALVLRRMNELLDSHGHPFPDGTDLRKGLLAKQVMAARRGAEPTVGLPVAAWVREHADHMIQALQQTGVRLVGEWDDLTPVDVPGVDPATVPDAEVAEAAIAGLAGLLAATLNARGETDDAEQDAEEY